MSRIRDAAASVRSQEILKLHERGTPLSRIAEQLKIPYSAVRGAAHLLGIAVERGRPKGLTAKTRKQLILVQNYRAQGKSFAEIGRLLGMKRQRVQQIAKLWEAEHGSKSDAA